MIHTNAGTTVIRGLPRRHVMERLRCPTDRDHCARMVHERHDGVTTGRLIAWCYDCRRVIPPPSAEPITFTAAERASVRWRRRTPAPVEDGDTRARNAEIRLAWAKHRIPQTLLASMYGLTPQRIGQIIHGGRRRRWA